MEYLNKKVYNTHMKLMHEEIAKIAGNYFRYMAKNFPVMCSNDEFCFFPRAKESLLYLDRLDSMDQEKIKQDLTYVEALLSRMHNLKDINRDLDTEIDAQLLKQSMNSFLREFGRAKSWQSDPTIYIRIYLLGIEQLVTKLKSGKAAPSKELASRIKKGIRLFEEARRNLKDIPELYKTTALELAASSLDYVRKELSEFLKKRLSKRASSELTKDAVSSLEHFRTFLKKKPTQKHFLKDRRLLEDLLKTSYSYDKRGLEEIFDIASEEYGRTLEEMKDISSAIKPSKKWRDILSNYNLKIKDPEKLLKIYSGQINKLKKFLIKEEVITIPKSQKILVEKTPGFFLPIRQTAFYRSPLTRGEGERALFYVTVLLSQDKKLLLKPFSNIHDEYIFVTAHETYPGHHLLDSKRKSLKNKIRRSVESALFYEGWASYVERLIDGLGYIKDPRQRLIGLKRQAWRAVRTMMDTGLRINRFSMEEAEKKLKDLGYHPRIVKSMVRHYALTYGYQLCYTVGKFEFERLREKFMPAFGMKKFHDLLLDSGEISFDLLEKKLEENV